MTRALIFGAFALSATLAVAGQAQLPPHQMRAQVDDSNRLKPSSEGAALFSQRCGACHFAFGMGTNLISARQAAAGQKPVGLLAERDDLVADYVKAVARQGKGAMPRQTRVDITDAELDKVAAYLGKGK
jgi:mono/diheme cytochrome c family protein